MRIVGGVDTDDVTVDLTVAINEFHTTVYGTALQIEDYRDFRFEKVWRVSYNDAEARMFAFFSTRYFLNLLPRDDARICLPILRSWGIELHQVSARPDIIHRHTQRFYEIFFPEIFHSLHFSSNIGTSLASSSRTKLDILRAINADFYVEDNLEYALAAADDVEIVFLMDQPWNQTRQTLALNVIRVDNWYSILYYLHQYFF